VRTEYDDERGWFRVDRGPVSLGFNIGPKAVEMPLPPGGDERVLLSSVPVKPASHRIELPPDAVCLVARPD
jgi:hypothetical protein